jgi:hypothetical protein
MLIGKIEHQQPPSRDEPQVNPDKIVKDPACSRVWDELSLLIRKRRPIILRGLCGGAAARMVDDRRRYRFRAGFRCVRACPHPLASGL